MLRGRIELFALVWAIGCGTTPAEPSGSEPEPRADAEADATPEARPEAKAGAGADVKPKPRPEPKPTFDAATAIDATVRVTKIVDLGGPPCGIVHSVAAIEVEVLGVGEPPPRLGLYVSCPADLQPKGMLEVGRSLRVALHASPQTWPKPAQRLDPARTIRYAKTLTPTEVGPL